MAENTSLKLTKEQKLYFDEVSDFNLEVRYPEYKREFYKRCTKEYTEKHFTRMKEQYKLTGTNQKSYVISAWMRLTILVTVVTLSSILPAHSQTRAILPVSNQANIFNAGFVCVDGVYNSELMAPYDVLQHTIFRDSTNYVRCFIVTPDGQPFVTFEGMRITPDYSFRNVPAIDILIIPSTETSMTADLKNSMLMNWLSQAVESATYVITLCDGAFPLAATGALDGRVATTFPADRQRLAKMFPEVEVRHEVNFVVDSKFITSVGGALSYEPALYLVEKLYSPTHARRTAEGLVLDWNLNNVPHLIVNSKADSK